MLGAIGGMLNIQVLGGEIFRGISIQDSYGNGKKWWCVFFLSPENH